jgi:DNA-binding MarR family transcriptional regulator
MSTVPPENRKLRREAEPQKIAADTDKERLRLWLKILKVSRIMEGELRERLRTEFDTTLPRFDVMAALYRAETGLRMSELSGVLKVSNGNVTGIVERLVGEGLMVRVPVEGDRRAMVVRLTQKGREDFEAMAATHKGWIDELLGGVAPDQAAALVAHLNSISAQLENRISARP